MLHLTAAELREVTGYKHRDLQAQALAKLGVPFKVRPADGFVLVLREVYVSLMSGQQKQKDRRGPNWHAA